MILGLIMRVVFFPFTLGIRGIKKVIDVAFLNDVAEDVSLYERIVRFLPLLAIAAGTIVSVFSYISFIVNGGYAKGAKKFEQEFVGVNKGEVIGKISNENMMLDMIPSWVGWAMIIVFISAVILYIKKESGSKGIFMKILFAASNVSIVCMIVGSVRSAVKNDMSFFGVYGSGNKFLVFLIVALGAFVIEYFMMLFSDSCRGMALALLGAVYVNHVFYPMVICTLENAISTTGKILFFVILISVIKFGIYCRKVDNYRYKIDKHYWKKRLYTRDAEVALTGWGANRCDRKAEKAEKKEFKYMMRLHDIGGTYK